MTTVRSRLLLPALALLLFATPSARAAWQPQGNPVCTANATQQQHAGCPDGSGGVYIVWADLRGGAAQMYAQHLLSDGSIAPGWPSQGVQVTNEFLAQLPAAVPDGAGGLLVIAQVGSNLVAQRIEPSGSIAPGFPPNGIALTSDLTNAQFAVTSDGAGGAWVLRDGVAAVNGQSRVRLTRVTRDGTFAPGWTASGVTLLNGVFVFNAMRVEADAAGGAVASANYVSPASFQSFTLFTRVRANGAIAQTQAAPTYLSNGMPPGTHGGSAIPDGRAGMIAIWVDEPSAGQSSWFGAHWDSTGAAVWPAGMTLGPPYYPPPFHAVSDGSGGAYLVGSSLGSFGPYAYRYAANGTAPPGWSATGLPIGGPDSPENALMRTPAGLLAIWSEHPSAQSDLRALLLTPNGVPAAGWVWGGNAVCTMPGDQKSPLLIPDGLGGAIGCWLDLRDAATTGQDVYATRLVESAPPVATDAALVEASAEPGRVLLRWWSADGPRFAAALEREAGGAGFSALADLTADGSGNVRYEDRDVETGATYRYRLVVSENGERRSLGETTVVVPGAASFSLEPVRPNPSNGRFTVAFTLPEARPARIDVFDLTGRLVWTEAFAPGHAGRFLVQREAGAAPGVYLLRLTQGRDSRTTRVVRAESDAR